ncbi:hypothetical protein KGF57_000775 [Candida theae]|uniref:Uncharacterized protein n=1 Tax=Candida theae TaxID=1198502 RepID=A0AAD5G0K6_9ASCO|nr:uncharacterized protein KGF57_000775 [Candida theae]KAI5965509.1 hypothetical protein KGF57_000775 [Candida theae]
MTKPKRTVASARKSVFTSGLGQIPTIGPGEIPELSPPEKAGLKTKNIARERWKKKKDDRAIKTMSRLSRHERQMRSRVLKSVNPSVNSPPVPEPSTPEPSTTVPSPFVSESEEIKDFMIGNYHISLQVGLPMTEATAFGNLIRTNLEIPDLAREASRDVNTMVTRFNANSDHRVFNLFVHSGHLSFTLRELGESLSKVDDKIEFKKQLIEGILFFVEHMSSLSDKLNSEGIRETFRDLEDQYLTTGHGLSKRALVRAQKLALLLPDTIQGTIKNIMMFRTPKVRLAADDGSAICIVSLNGTPTKKKVSSHSHLYPALTLFFLSASFSHRGLLIEN